MRISRDSWFLIVVLVLFAVVAYYITITSSPGRDTPSSYCTGKRGTKALYMLLERLDVRVGRHFASFEAIPDDAGVLFLVDPMFLSDVEEQNLVRWIEKGNTLILAVSNPLGMPNRLGINVNWRRSRRVYARVTEGRYVDGVKRVWLESSASVLPDKSITCIVRDKRGIVMAEKSLGKGRVIFIGNGLFLANSGIRHQDNVVLATNFVYENAGRNDLVLFTEYDPFLQMLGKKDLPPIMGSGGWLSLSVVGLTILLALISAGQRFGAVHPLPEREERRRGWELVHAMAGIYRRADARELAMTAVYQSFWRELITKFGVTPSASSEEAAQTVFRAVNTDKARLSALLSRCEQVAAGQNISDSEALMLAESIEDFRRELGIARSTND